MIDLWQWALGAAVGLVALVGAYFKGKVDMQRKDDHERLQGMKNAKEIYDDVQTLDDKRVIDEFDRLHDSYKR